MVYKQATATFNSQVAGVIAEGLTNPEGCGISNASIADVAVTAGGGVIAVAARSRGSAKRRLIPALPTVLYEAEHRPQLGRRLPIPTCVAKPGSRKVQQSNPHARAAMDAEWDRLRRNLGRGGCPRMGRRCPGSSASQQGSKFRLLARILLREGMRTPRSSS